MAFRDELHLFRQAREAVKGQYARKDVQDIFFGAAYVDRRETGKLAIRFNVKKKRARSNLKSSELIPSSINGLPTDVTEFRFRQHVRNEPAYDRVRPLLGGVQIQAASFEGPLEWGTLGCRLVFNNRTYGISNEHVLVNEADVSDAVYQPKRAAFGQVIGHLSGIADQRLDYRLVVMQDIFDGVQSINGIPGLTDGFMMPAGLNSLLLVKAGAASGVTRGVYDGRSLIAPHRVTVRAMGNDAVSLPGDSGSMWVNEAVGGRIRMFALHTGGDEEGRLALATLYASIHSSVHRQLRSGLV